MADISATIKESPAGNNFQSPVVTRSYLWDPVLGKGAGGTATKTAATHNIVAIPEGEAFVGGFFVVTEAFAGTSSTVQFQAAGLLTDSIAEAELTVGCVVPLVTHAYATMTTAATLASALDCASGKCDNYVDGTTITAETIDAIVGTATLTAGKGFLVLDFVDVSRITEAV